MTPDGFNITEPLPAAVVLSVVPKMACTNLFRLIVMVFVASLCFSVIVSRQRQQIERLIEETAILSAELRDLRAEVDEHSEPVRVERRGV